MITYKKSLNTNISSLTANDLAVYKRMKKKVGQHKEEIANQIGTVMRMQQHI